MRERIPAINSATRIEFEGHDLVVGVGEIQITFNGESQLDEENGQELKEDGLDLMLVSELGKFRDCCAWYGYDRFVVGRAIDQLQGLRQEGETDVALR